MEANVGHVPGYGDDPFTERAISVFQQHFGTGTEVFFVFGGTGANVTGLAAGLEWYQAVVCPEFAHIYIDECGAPERFTGCKLIGIPTPDGKLTIDLLISQLRYIGDLHAAQPKIISITQPTEWGTLYSLDEISKLADFAHSHHLLLHMDGARICNAAEALDLPFRTFTRNAGVDILSFGGTKNGMLVGEAVLFFDPVLGNKFRFLQKQGTQLPSKMRFISAQFSALLSEELWLQNARRANRMAHRLATNIGQIPDIRLAFPVEANLLFAYVPEKALKILHEDFFFYEVEKGLARWVTSFDTTEEDVDHFIQQLKQALAT
jgi:threonine aldolase